MSEGKVMQTGTTGEQAKTKEEYREYRRRCFRLYLQER